MVIRTKEELAPLVVVEMDALSLINQNEELILYSTHPYGNYLTLNTEYPSKKELFETLLSHPHFQELCTDRPSVDQWVQQEQTLVGSLINKNEEEITDKTSTLNVEYSSEKELFDTFLSDPLRIPSPIQIYVRLV